MDPLSEAFSQLFWLFASALIIYGILFIVVLASAIAAIAGYTVFIVKRYKAKKKVTILHYLPYIPLGALAIYCIIKAFEYIQLLF